MAIHSSTIAWKIPCTEEPGRLQSMGSQSRTTERLTLYLESNRRMILSPEASGLWFHSLVAQRVKHLPTMQDTRVPSLGWEDPLEKGMQPTPSILPWRIPWTKEPGRLQSVGLQRAGHD